MEHFTTGFEVEVEAEQAFQEPCFSRFLDLPLEIQSHVFRFLPVHDLRALTLSSSKIYHWARESLYAASELRLRSACGQQEEELRKLSRQHIFLYRPNPVSPARLVRNLTLVFSMPQKQKSSSFRPDESYDHARVGYPSIIGLSLTLARISHKTFPRLRNLTLDVHKTSDLWDERNHHPHWFVAKALSAMVRRLHKLHRIKISTRETKDLDGIRVKTALAADTCSSHEDRARYKRDASRHQRELEYGLNHRRATFFDVMSELLTYNLPHNQGRQTLEKSHAHGAACQGDNLKESSQELWAWRDKYCPGNWKLETLDLDDVPDELAGVKMGITINNVIDNTKGYHTFVGDHLLWVFRTIQNDLAFQKNASLRNRKRVDYAGQSSGRAQSKRVKRSPKVSKS